MAHELVPCPHCGDEILESAEFCRYCGASDSDGWADGSESDYDDDFDYDEFAEREFGGGSMNTSLPMIYRIAVLLLLISFLMFWVFAV